MKTQRLIDLYDFAKEQGIVKSKKEFATAIGAGYTTLVRTMNGEHYYSPDKHIRAAEDMLRQYGFEPDCQQVNLNTIWTELQEQRKMLEKLLKLAEKGHI